MYLPSSGATIEARQSWLSEGRVVAAGQLEAGRVENRDVGIEERVAQPQPFELGGEPLALLQLDDEVIDVFGLHDAADGARSAAIGCGAAKSLFGSTSFTSGRVPTVNVRRLLTPVERADADGVDAEPAIGGDGEHGLDRVVACRRRCS